MPNAKVLEEKKALVASLVEKIKNSPAGVLVDYKGINVEDDTKLRRELREAGVEYAVVKNTMLRFAAKELGFDAGFGAGTYADDVITFAAKEIARRIGRE